MKSPDTPFRNASPQGADAVEYTRRRRAMAYFNFAMTALLLLCVIVVVNVMAREHQRRFNWTVDKIEELSPETVRRIRAVNLDVDVLVNRLVIGQFGQDKSLPEAWRLVQEMLREFQRLNPRIRVTEAEEQGTLPPWLIKSGQAVFPNKVYLHCKGPDDKPILKMFHIRELYEGDAITGEIMDFHAEVRLVSAIYSMVNPKRRVVYFTEGHDEARVEEFGENGLSELARNLRERDNVEFRRLRFEGETPQVPRDADAVLVAGARRDFPKEHLDALRDYLEEAGRLFVAVDPAGDTPQLRRFLSAWGAEVGKGIVLDVSSHVERSPMWIRVLSFGNHPINAEFEYYPDIYIDVPVATQVKPGNPPDGNLRTMSLFRSSPESFLDANGNRVAEPDEAKSNIDLAVAVQGTPSAKPRFADRKVPRIVAIGSIVTLWNRNHVNVASNPAGMTHLLNCFRWLLELEEVITAPGRRIKMKVLDLQAADRQRIAWISMGALPLLGIVLGILAWWFRRK